MGVKTRRELVDELQQQYDIPEDSPASEFIVAFEAPKRERDRNIRTANEASWYGYNHVKTLNPRLESADMISALVLLLDLVGVGGHKGMGWTFNSEGSSKRLLDELGSGRWHASDAPAYREAAIAAFVNLTNNTQPRIQFEREGLFFSAGPTAGGVSIRYENQNPEVLQRIKTLVRAGLYGFWHRRNAIPITGPDIGSNPILLFEVANDFKSLAHVFNNLEG